MVDQDLSLFHDTAPLFSLTDLGATMPDSDGLWQAASASEWSELFNQVHEFAGGYPSVGSNIRPISLKELFRHFLDDEIVVHDVQMIPLTPLHLRLLLHQLQVLVCQYCQLLSCFSDTSASRSHSMALSAASTRVRLDEVRGLLRRWFDLAQRYMESNPMCSMMQANLVMFHLISMSAVTDFPEIERLARREAFDGTYEQLTSRHRKCISDVREAIVHAGQVLRLITAMPRGIRPPWWAAAIYRAALVMWADAFVFETLHPNQQGQFPPPNTLFPIDRLPSDHPSILSYLRGREGVPTVTMRDGTPVPLNNCFAVLSHCIDVIDAGVGTRFSDGIRSKLERLARG